MIDTARLNLPITRSPVERVWHVFKNRVEDLTLCGIVIDHSWFITRPAEFGGDANECDTCEALFLDCLKRGSSDLEEAIIMIKSHRSTGGVSLTAAETDRLLTVLENL